MSGKIAGAKNRALQVAEPRCDGWTQKKRKLFLDMLAATCNVAKALEAADMGRTGAYALRRRDPVFAELWREALAIGYEQLEAALLQRAIEGVNAIEIEVAENIDPLELAAKSDMRSRNPLPGAGGNSRDLRATTDVQLALLMLNRHRAAVEGKGSDGGFRGRATQEETDAALRKHLDALARRLKAQK